MFNYKIKVKKKNKISKLKSKIVLEGYKKLQLAHFFLLKIGKYVDNYFFKYCFITI